MEKLATLRAKRGEIVDKMAVLADSETVLTDEQKTQFDANNVEAISETESRPNSKDPNANAPRGSFHSVRSIAYQGAHSVAELLKRLKDDSSSAG